MFNTDRLLMQILLLALLAACLLVLAPFWSALFWAAVLAFASWPLMRLLTNALDGRINLAAGLLTGDRGQSLVERLERTAATLACHAAFRAGDVLQPEAVQHLLAAMEHADLAGYCPHGRPAILRVPLTELGRFFAR